MEPRLDSPPAQGARLDWFAVPERVLQAFEAWVGSGVASATSQPSGFSPGVAARLRLADGRGVFVKAVGPIPNGEAANIHRREARIASALPLEIPAPRLRWCYDDDQTGWVVLAFDEVAGCHPVEPWRLDELQRVLDSLAELAERLTQSPLGAETVGSASEAVAKRLCGWQRLCSELPRASYRREAAGGPTETRSDGVGGGPATREVTGSYAATSTTHTSRPRGQEGIWNAEGLRDRLDPWSLRHLDALAELESGAAAAVGGNTLLHFDVRADNILLDRDHVWFFDWPHACVGADWLDVVGFAPSVTMQGGPSPEEVFRRYPSVEAADKDAVTAAIAAVAGYFTREALRPPPAGLPTLRAFQAAQGVVARQWLAQRTGWA